MNSFLPNGQHVGEGGEVGKVSSEGGGGFKAPDPAKGLRVVVDDRHHLAGVGCHVTLYVHGV